MASANGGESLPDRGRIADISRHEVSESRESGVGVTYPGIAASILDLNVSAGRSSAPMASGR
jgi:hypothetical protein